MRTLTISGSRHWTNYHEFRRHIDGLHATEPIACIHVGDCRFGVDAMADRWARENEVDLMRYAAKWSKQENAAGPLRNNRLAQGCGTWIAFPGPKSKGTRDFIRKAPPLTGFVIEVDE